MADRAAAFHELMDSRRSVRMFDDRPVPRDVIETAIRTASTAPSGAHMQPWTFVAVSEGGGAATWLDYGSGVWRKV